MDNSKLNELILSRILIEKLLLKRNPLEYQAYIETFRESLIDANPHQVESVVFALEKLENGGCVFADEVGLGKTIEAGLVISQYRARRKFNVLIIVPTSLAGQWNSELRKLFQIPSKIITSQNKRGLKEPEIINLFKEPSIYILGRELASGLEKKRILSRKEWNLIIVDEAHEVFANIHRRFNSRDGEYKENSKDSRIAGNMFRLFKRYPILLLTATPIQNNILELWGLSSYIQTETKKNYLGQFNHFKELFIQSGEINIEKIPELKNRISSFLVRNIRKNAQVFMKYKFTDRNCETLNFNMDDNEKAIYDDISNYFERDDIYAYSTNGIVDMKDEKFGGIRTLLKMSYRRALGSSFSALILSLEGIIERLEDIKKGELPEIDEVTTTDDYENDEEDKISLGLGEDDLQKQANIPKDIDINGIISEIEEINGYIKRARKIDITSKDKIILNNLRKVLSNPDRFYQKAVIFTTYIATQQHLKKILEENGFKDEVVLFSGSSRRNPEQRNQIDKAITIWEEEIGHTIPHEERPSGNILERTALIHYFHNRKKILISTEAGAKGLNLQFCNVIINYDLPWNPQRIEQRIGRCHRYGQQRDVLVINCINADNETEQRIYKILENKFNLFQSVLGAGDDILGTLSKAINFEYRINDILNNFKTSQERLIYLQKLEEEIDERTKNLRDKKLIKTRKLLDELDPHVTMKLKDIKDKLPESFSQYDEDMLNLFKLYAICKNLHFKVFDKKDEQIFFEFDNNQYYIGKRDEENIKNHQHISLKNRLLKNIIDKIHSNTNNLQHSVIFNYTQSESKSEILKPFVNCYGRWDFYKICFTGLEEEEILYDVISVKNNNEIKFLSFDEIKALKKINFFSDRKIQNLLKNSNNENYLKNKIEEDTKNIQNRQQYRIDRKLQNLKIELKDMEEYLIKKDKEIKKNIDDIDKIITNTFNREEGKKLINQKGKLQKELNKTQTNLLEFKNKFYDLYNEEELKLIEKRFIETEAKKLFSLNFQIK